MVEEHLGDVHKPKSGQNIQFNLSKAGPTGTICLRLQIPTAYVHTVMVVPIVKVVNHIPLYRVIGIIHGAFMRPFARSSEVCLEGWCPGILDANRICVVGPHIFEGLF